ncbi:MAG: DNA translocase FtsK 4TM domain-containing protein, partial [Gemmataceae bacterium]
MPLERAWRLDLAAFLLFLSGLLVGVAVFSHDPYRQPGAVYPAPESGGNLLGKPGDLLARDLVHTLGLAVYVWLATWFVLVIVLLLRRHWWVWLFRLLGWLILIPAAGLLLHRHGTMIPGAPPLGGGGLMGAALDAWLDQRIPGTRGVVLSAAITLAGVFLAFDWAMKGIMRQFRRLRYRLAQIRLPRLRRESKKVEPVVA